MQYRKLCTTYKYKKIIFQHSCNLRFTEITGNYVNNCNSYTILIISFSNYKIRHIVFEDSVLVANT